MERTRSRPQAQEGSLPSLSGQRSDTGRGILFAMTLSSIVTAEGSFTFTLRAPSFDARHFEALPRHGGGPIEGHEASTLILIAGAGIHNIPDRRNSSRASPE